MNWLSSYLALFWFLSLQDVFLSDEKCGSHFPAAQKETCLQPLSGLKEYRKLRNSFSLMGTKLKGRPKLTEGKRVKKIDARFNDKEYAVILELEKQLGIRKTDLIRLRVLHQAQNVLVNAKEMISLLDSIGAELGRSGNNINQLARYANTLKKQGTLSPVVAERFNFLFATYLDQQKTLEVGLRKIIRMFGT